MPYSSPSDIYAFGLPRGATPNPGRVLASAVDSVCTLDGHGFETGDEILFNPAGDGALPAGLAAGTTYYAEALNEHTFRVRATAGGAALTFSDAEDPLMVIAPLNREAAIEWADRLIDDMCPGQAVPFDDASLYPAGVPPIVRMTSAELASGKLLSVTGGASRSLSETVDAAVKRLARWAGGVPLRGTPNTTRANLAASSPPGSTTSGYIAPAADPRGWRRYGGL